MCIITLILRVHREHALTLLSSPQIPQHADEPPLPESPDEDAATRLEKSRQAWESEEAESVDILDRFLKVKQFAGARIPSYESKSRAC